MSTTARNSARTSENTQVVVRAPWFCPRRLDCIIHHHADKNQSYFFIAASKASGSKSNEISKLESGSAPAPSFASPPCRFRAGLVAAAVTIEGETRDTVAGLGRGGRNGLLTAEEYCGCGVLDGGTMRVMPNARLDPCACDAGSAGTIEVEVEVAEVELVVVEVQRRESGDLDLEVVSAAVGPPPLDDSAANAAGGGGRGGPKVTGTRNAIGSGVGAGRAGVGEGSSSCFWGGCLVRGAAGRGGKWCVPFCGSVEAETGGSIVMTLR